MIRGCCPCAVVVVVCFVTSTKKVTHKKQNIHTQQVNTRINPLHFSPSRSLLPYPTYHQVDRREEEGAISILRPLPCSAQAPSRLFHFLQHRPDALSVPQNPSGPRLFLYPLRLFCSYTPNILYPNTVCPILALLLSLNASPSSSSSCWVR